MSIFFTTQHIPELAGLNFQQRMLTVRQAATMISTPKKVVLNTIKLIILAHFFSILVRFEGWLLLPYLLLAGMVYPLVINPVTFTMAHSKMAKARKKLEFDQEI